mgnify:CR=1 FL=1
MSVDSSFLLHLTIMKKKVILIGIEMNDSNFF